MFDEFKNRFIVEGDIVTVTAIHIGTTETGLNSNRNKNTFFRASDGQPLIPGSTLKGVMRSFSEQLLKSEVFEEKFSGKRVCTKDNPCIDMTKYQTLLNKKDKNAEEELAINLFGNNEKNGDLCLVCRLFGSNYNCAKAFIRDAKVIENTFHEDFEIRSGVSIDRELGKSVDNHLYEVEVVPEGTKFSFHMVLENIDNEEWEYIKLLLNAMKLGMISIGGMKSRGLGEVLLENIKYIKIDRENIKSYLKNESLEFELLNV